MSSRPPNGRTTAGSGTAPLLSLGCTREGGVTVVQVCGDLDMGSAPLLVDLARRLGAERTPLVVLDLSRVGFVDLHGLTALTEAQALVRQGQGHLTLRHLPRRLTRLLQLTGVTLPAPERAAGDGAKPVARKHPGPARDGAGPPGGDACRFPSPVDRQRSARGSPAGSSRA